MRGRVHAIASVSLLLSACGDGSGSTPAPAPSPSPSGGSGGGSATFTFAAPAPESLTIPDVERVIAQAAAQAAADSKPAVIAVTDRVGNVLAIFRMIGAPTSALIPRAPDGSSNDAQGLSVPGEAAAVAKAITGAYLSSGGNAFSSRTASMIVQTHFPPAPNTAGLESGPLFGVQFSQLPCSDLSARFAASGADALIGPKRSPLGLSADPGGFPLYKNGVLVGGVGVIGDGAYGFDANVLDLDSDSDERAALAGTIGFEAPSAIRADQITVDGTSLRYSDASYAALTNAAGASYAATNPARGALAALIGYTASTPAIRAGTVYGSEASGLRAASMADFARSDAFVLSDGAGANRYPSRAGTDTTDVGTAISAAESRALLGEAFAVMAKARAQIRRPLDSAAQVSIALVDTRGAVLGIVRSPDAPVFGIDVSLQKARSAAFFSSSRAASDLGADPSSDVRAFLGTARTFLGDSAALTGATAFSNRAIGNLARSYFPDGEVGRPNGPLARPVARFNPFSTGLQSALVLTNLAQHLAFASGASAADTARRCTLLPDAVPGQNRLQNGLQIFPGAVPVYRGAQLVGAMGVSGDGIDQDDMIAFLGTHNAGLSAGGLGNATAARRADTLRIGGVRLRYVSCPFAPFLGTSDQNVCQGL